MSRIGKKPIVVPDNVTVSLSGKNVTAKGPLGEETVDLMDGISISQNDDILTITADENTGIDEKTLVAYTGLFRSLVNNIVVGVSEGFEKDLEIVGIGYRASQQSKDIVLQLGFSHNITFTAPDGITLEVADPTKIKIKGSNKQKVGQVAANIRELRPPEPYKGKGIRYKDEYVRKKAGKAGK